MSWDADLVDDRGHNEGSWNYTHNTNTMIAEALASLGHEGARDVPTDHPIWNAIGPPWWRRLDGCDGATGAAFLNAIVVELRRDPEKYEAMNPPNGWGTYETLVKVLEEMRDAVPEWPTVWYASG